MKASVFLLVVVLFSAAFALEIEDAERQKVSQFRSFQKKFNKNYASEEVEVRYSNFKKSLERIEARNSKFAGKGAQYGITKFSDLSTEEFKNLYLTAKVDPKERIKGIEVMKPKVSLNQLPATLDWRKKGLVTPVKDQGQCGSCWAFSVTENIESKWLMAGKANSTLRLAPQQLVDCSDLDLGCNGGNTAIAYEYVIYNGGLMSEASYPYAAVDQTCAFKASEVVAKISTWKYATWDYSEDEMQANLVSWGPLSVCVDAASWQDYQSGIMTWEECAYVNMLDHCVQLVGYNVDPTGKKYWMVRNSWNTDWGINGYIHLAMGGDTCGIAHQPSSAFL